MRFPSVNGPAFTAAHASSYVEGTSRKVPGLAALHRMTSMLVAERAPVQARVLVLGAGGGMELKALADENSDWSFCGIDPSADMLRVAEQTVGPHLPRVHLQQGYIGAAPEGPFDAAVCLLTLHFVGRAQRLDTLEQIRRRLVPGAPFVVAHISFPQSEPERSTWIARHVAFGGTASGEAEKTGDRHEVIGSLARGGRGGASQGGLLGCSLVLCGYDLQGLGGIRLNSQHPAVLMVSPSGARERRSYRRDAERRR